MATIAFPMQPQKGQYLCWCAVSVSVDFFYNPASSWQQCSMAEQGLHVNGCCGANPLPAQCDQPGALDVALSIEGRLLGPPTAGPLQFQDIQNLINSNRPVCVRIGWYAGGGHFVVVSGWSVQGGVQQVNVEDPYYGPSVVEYNTFCNGYHYGQGMWTHTYPV